MVTEGQVKVLDVGRGVSPSGASTSSYLRRDEPISRLLFRLEAKEPGAGPKGAILNASPEGKGGGSKFEF